MLYKGFGYVKCKNTEEGNVYSCIHLNINPYLGTVQHQFYLGSLRLGFLVELSCGSTVCSANGLAKFMD
jgi:hypothetical protein